MNYDDDRQAEYDEEMQKERREGDSDEPLESYHLPGHDGQETTELGDLDAALARLK